MKELIKKYDDKLVAQGLCSQGDPVLGGIDADIVWNREAPEIQVLEEIIAGLNINSILFSKPAEPYFSILNYLGKRAIAEKTIIKPEDAETRTFLHDIPVAETFTARPIIEHLKKRKSVLIPDHGIVTYGTVSPEQAFVTYSSVCFSGYVKFFTDYICGPRLRSATSAIVEKGLDTYERFLNAIPQSPAMKKGPFLTGEDVFDAIIESGKLTIESRMVDSFFGNISYKLGETIYISQTASSLDELEGCIDPCPIDNSSTNAITASSEFTAHKSIYSLTGNSSILHGHPKFSVIISMICHEDDCANRGKCHIKCSKKRFIEDIPIVAGEVGTGPTGLCNTLPPALTGRGAIVYGHGLFTVGKKDFTDAFQALVDVERLCFNAYKKMISGR
ncbi:MAG: rRNA adenine dimethylase [bacterium]|nr:rRNA adenine dimethylase [bacterium]